MNLTYNLYFRTFIFETSDRFIVNFTDFGLDPQLTEALSWMGINEPTPIQQEAIPAVLKGNDIIGCAQTGTGKTAAFLLPVLHTLMTTPGKGKNSIRAIIIAPTRELAKQIDQQVDGFGYFTGLSSTAVYGGGSGVDFSVEKKAMSDGCDIVVATPGRLLSHLNLGYVKCDELEFLIMDEADRMLDMGFAEDIDRIVKQLPTTRQTLFFSATMPPKIRNLARKTLKNPVEISISISKTASGVTQEAYLVYEQHKLNLIIDILKKGDFPSVIIFCSTKSNTKTVSAELQKRGLPAKSFHSDLDQEEREERMREFKNKNLQILVGTDIISRGIDIEDISLVVNYAVPQDAEDYVHRVGRTARAASKGNAITFISDEDMYRFARIEELIQKEIPKLFPPDGIGTGPQYDANAKQGPRGGRGGSGGGKRPFKKRSGGGGGYKGNNNRNQSSNNSGGNKSRN